MVSWILDSHVQEWHLLCSGRDALQRLATSLQQAVRKADDSAKRTLENSAEQQVALEAALLSKRAAEDQLAAVQQVCFSPCHDLKSQMLTIVRANWVLSFPRLAGTGGGAEGGGGGEGGSSCAGGGGAAGEAPELGGRR